MNTIKRYSYIVNKQFKVNKKRNISTIIGIILSIILFTTIGYIKSYYNDINILDAKDKQGNYEAVFANISKEEGNKLENNILVNKVGFYDEVYSSTININGKDKYIYVYSGDEVFIKDLVSPVLDIISGRLPKNSNEIIIDDIGKDLLNKNIGDNVTFKGKRYKIVGFYNKKQFRRGESIDFVTYLNKENIKDKVNAAFTVKVNKNKEKVIKKIGEDLGVYKDSDKENNQLFFNELLLYNYENANINSLVLLYGITLILTVLLIYGSINVSIKERIEQFSILRCIGATPSKIRLFLLKESILLTIFSLVPGIILGQFLCYFISGVILEKVIKINNHGISYKFYGGLILTVVILTIINITIATIIPIIKIGRISPIEGLRTGGVIEKGVKSRRSKIVKKIFGYNGELAYKNIRANNKTFIITTAVSIIILTTFIVFTGYNKTILEGYKEDNKYTTDISLNIFHELKGEDIFNEVNKYKNEIENFNIFNEVFSKVYSFTSGIFNDVQLNKGVKIKENNFYKGETNIEGEKSVYSDNINIIIMDDNTLKELIRLNNNLDVDVESFKENGVLIADRLVMKNYITPVREPLFNLKKGDEFTLDIKNSKDYKGNESIKEDIDYIKKNSKEVKLKYLGSIDGSTEFSGRNFGSNMYTTLIVSKDFYNNNKDLFKGIIKIRDLDFSMNFKEGIDRLEAIEIMEDYSSKVEGLLIDNNESNKIIKDDIMISSSIVYIIMILIIIVGSVNIINNKNINIKLRGKEIGTLLALGISKKRLKKILILEGVVQWFIASIISVTLSYLILSILYNILYMTEQIDRGIIPVIAMIFGVLVLFIINILGGYLSIRKLKYINTIDLIKNNE